MKLNKNVVTAMIVLLSTAGTSHLMQSTWQADTPDAQAPIRHVEDTKAELAESVIQPNVTEVTSAVDKPAITTVGPRPLTISGPRLAALAAADMPKALVLPVRLDTTKGVASPDTPIVLPDMPPEAASPAALPMPGPSPLDRLAMTTADEVPESVVDLPDVSEYGVTCGIILSAAERPAAMVNLSVTAPCRGGERITVRHGGLIYSAALDGLGMYNSEVPALAQNAAFAITFADGTVRTTEVDVPEADQTERVALQFNGRTGLQIHALEFGADYGAQGHVWSGNPRNAETALAMGGGYVTSLGDPALPGAFLAEVYTLPRNVTDRDGVVRLSVEAEVSSDNCARTIAGETLQRSAMGKMDAVSLTLSMPGCDAIGEFLVLKNLLRDLKIASN